MLKNEDKTEYELEEVLLSFQRFMEEFLLSEAKEYGHPLNHLEVLDLVFKKKEVPMKEIAKWLNITPPSASSIVDGLVKKKLVKRKIDKKDRRITIVSLDERASKMFTSFEQKRNLIFEKMFNSLEEEDKNNLARILIKIINNQKIKHEK